jgi:SAM-dependent methyltransferase
MESEQDAALPTPFDDGDLYDLLCAELDYGIDYYLSLAQRAHQTGPVLDVACGTGRVLLPCLKAGVNVDGLDLYPAMLKRLRTKAAALGFAPTLYQSSMSAFNLPRRYALVMIPFNAFVHNLTADDQISCLRCCREHLTPGGLLAFDGFFPGARLITMPNGTRDLEMEMKHPETGLPVRLYDTRTFDRVRQLMHSHNEIEMLDADGKVARTDRFQTTLRWIYKSEMELLLRLAGFSRWEIFGDFSRRPLLQDTDGMVVEAWSE